jgi:hypothetical protein
MASLIQLLKEDTLVYTPGFPGLPQPFKPPETIPEMIHLPPILITRGPPESPYS